MTDRFFMMIGFTDRFFYIGRVMNWFSIVSNWMVPMSLLCWISYWVNGFFNMPYRFLDVIFFYAMTNWSLRNVSLFIMVLFRVMMIFNWLLNIFLVRMPNRFFIGRIMNWMMQLVW